MSWYRLGLGVNRAGNGGGAVLARWEKSEFIGKLRDVSPYAGDDRPMLPGRGIESDAVTAASVTLTSTTPAATGGFTLHFRVRVPSS